MPTIILLRKSKTQVFISNFLLISACKNSLIPCNRRDSLDTLDTHLVKNSIHAPDFA